MRSIALLSTLLLSAPGIASAASITFEQLSSVAFETTGPTAGDIQGTVDNFRIALGDNNGNAPVTGDPRGRRQIDWDAAPDFIADPNAFPGDFFNAGVNPRARGIEFRTVGETTGFALSSTEASGTPVAFGEEGNFNPFSQERMFRPVGDAVFDVLFFDPTDQVTPATTRGLGVVFNDFVQDAYTGEVDGDTFMEFFGVDDELLLRRDVLAGEDGGLSFLGVVFDEPEIARVRITAGGGPGLYDFANGVVMDDFIFGEPIAIADIAPVPLPASILLLGAAVAGFGFVGRKRQL